MDSDIEQLKKENESLRNRYVPDEEDTQETLMIKIDENTDNYIVRIKCIGDPMWGKKYVEDEIYYLKGLPCASVLHYKMHDVLEDMIDGYEGNMDLFLSTRSKFFIPKTSCDRGQLMEDIVDIMFETRDELGWHSEYEERV